MGMIGKFMAVDYQDLEAILSGEKSILSLENELAVDIDKAWQAIGYLVCGSLFDTDDAPMCYVVPMMGENVIESEMDFGAFYLTAEQVREANDYLLALDEEAIKASYDFETMVQDEVYPISEEEDKDEFFQYVYHHFLNLKAFYKLASQQEKAVVFYIM